ncbi:MAG: phosphoribosylformylglycinamidine cyclo-ligase [Rickettsiales bacterium]|nr:phosphoribosylformylglycinamidine cyclo-ligase [Rickettsiales bacterium]
MKKTKTLPKAATYKQAGVDIDAGDALVERIKPFAKATVRKGSVDGLGGFGALFDLKKAGYTDPLLVSSTDGVGTKLKIAQELNRHDSIGIDLVAMCVNDLVVQGAEPLFFLDYFATGKLAVGTAASVIEGIAKGCKESGCALVGGETAEMPGMYAPGEYDLAGFSVGAVNRDALLPRKGMKKGDVVLGLASSGVHSNGFSLVRHIMALQKMDYHAKAPFSSKQTLGEVLLTPTKLYVKSCLKALKKHPESIRALAHITGGGLDNIPRVLPKNLAVDLREMPKTLPPVFQWLKEAGNVPMGDMRRTFNCGTGMVLVVAKEAEAPITKLLTAEGEKVTRLGVVVKRDGEAVIA